MALIVYSCPAVKEFERTPLQVLSEFTETVKIVFVPSETLTVAPGLPVPAIVGMSSTLVAPFAGTVITGASRFLIRVKLTGSLVTELIPFID